MLPIIPSQGCREMAEEKLLWLVVRCGDGWWRGGGVGAVVKVRKKKEQNGYRGSHAGAILAGQKAM